MLLKRYQEDCLNHLRTYLRLCGQVGAKRAFIEQTDRPYNAVGAFGAGLPYVCLRVPTGGGKTLIASHAVPLAVRELLHSDRGVVLWLAPTTKIVEQTLKRLRDVRDPYRVAAEAGGPVRVLTLAEALYLSKADADGATIIIVMPIQALRVNDTEGRRIYDDNGQLMPHFEDRRVVEAARERLDWLEEEDRPRYSLANVLALRRGTVVVDEAHNARTTLTFEAFDRLKPAGLLELTATPLTQGDYASNVLHGVSAAELKAEDMVKLPVMLTTRPDWRALLTEAVEKRAELEAVWREETASTGEALRPILLVQAESRGAGERLVPEAVKRFLTDDLGQPAESVRIVTGDEDELGDDPAGDVGCEVRTIITVQKLREGWDCPAAYVLCSVANLASDVAAEQMLGRVLRMPAARRKSHEALNRAYAYVTGSFRDAAARIETGLVSCGMERYEATQQVRPNVQRDMDFGPLFGGPAEAEMSPDAPPPRLDALPPTLRERFHYEADNRRLTYTGPTLTGDEAQQVRAAVGEPVVAERIIRQSAGLDAAPADLGVVLLVPQMAVVGEDGQRELFEAQYRDVPWRVSDHDATLAEAEFTAVGSGRQEGVVDVDAEAGAYHQLEEMREQLQLFDRYAPQDANGLAAWMARRIPHPDLVPSDVRLWLRDLVDHLLGERGMALKELNNARFRLAEAAAVKIDAHRRGVYSTAYETLLFPEAGGRPEVTPALAFGFPLNAYPYNRLYGGRERFRRHYYANVGDMNGEEADVAHALDNHPMVETWVRNLERDDCGFWIPTADGKFFPDFVARLRDGRHVAVEHKGQHLDAGEREQAKKRAGERWAECSDGRCEFGWTVGAKPGNVVSGWWR